MSRPTGVGWVEPATPIRGLDHLGVQGPCIAQYAQLLPGITERNRSCTLLQLLPVVDSFVRATLSRSLGRRV